MGSACGTRIRRRRTELGLTQLELAEKTGLSEAAIRSYELGSRNPKDAHRKVIAKALGVSPDYLREHDDYKEDEVMHFLMEMEEKGLLAPMLIDGVAYIMPIQPNLEESVQEWAEHEYDFQIEEITEDDYRKWKSEYSAAGAGKRISKPAANSHFSWQKAKMSEKHMEEELAKLPADSNRNKIRDYLIGSNE